MTNRIIKPATPELRTRLSDFKSENNLTVREIGQQLGVSSSQVSRYLSDTFVGDIDHLEGKVQDVLRTAPIRKIVNIETFETRVTRQITGGINLILKTNDFGVIHGPAGIGKTVAGARYTAENPTAFFLTLSQDCNNAHYIQKQLFLSLKTRGYRKSGLNRAEYIFDRLKESNRPLIIDNAHRATASARKYLFDLNDLSRVPIIMLGNPEIIDVIRQNDQQFSRIGLCPRVALADEDFPVLAKSILEQMCPEHADALMDYATTVASHPGHLRALRKQITLTQAFMEADPKLTAANAFRRAHQKLVRNYNL